MAQTGSEQFKKLILTGDRSDEQTRRTAWELALEHNLLTGRVRMSPPAEDLQKTIIRKVVFGEKIDPTTKSSWTMLPHLVLNDNSLLPERLGLQQKDLPKAREFFKAMDADLSK